MKENRQHKKRRRGGQPGNQNARTHGNYSRLFSPHEAEVLKAIAGLDAHGQHVILRHLLILEISYGLESHSSHPMREKTERILENPDFNAALHEWAEERNINIG